MKNKFFSLLLMISSLALISLSCGLSSASLAESPKAAPPLPNPVSTDESEKLYGSPTATLPPVEKPLPTLAVQPTPTAPASVAMPTLTAPVDANGDGKIDMCEVIPQAVLEGTIGRKLVAPGQLFQNPALGSGCAYDFGKDSSEAYFAYVTLASEKQFTDALASAVKAEPVTTIGDSAFLNYGADARQLWARVGKSAILIAIGDRENVPAEMVLAPYLVKYAAGLGN
jgi:hypothetical protein